jgi:SAM-dependent methyltransferase
MLLGRAVEDYHSVSSGVFLKYSLLALLECPACHDSFDIHQETFEDLDVIEGSLLCQGCKCRFPIVRGVPRFLRSPLNAEQKATASAFGYEWTHYSKLTEADRKEFLAWISPLSAADFKDQVVLDAGCGKGRHIYLASQFGARTVVGVDLSDAVDAAFRNTRTLTNVHVIQADILDLPLKTRFDLAYSIGVVHHLPVPKAGFIAVAGHVKPGGRIATWVYGREGNLWIEKLVDPVRRNLTSRLPRFFTRCLCFFPAVTLFAGLRVLYRPAKTRNWLKTHLPYADYLCSISDYTFSENFWNVFDQLVAPTAFYHSHDEVVDWFKTVGADQVRIGRHNSNSWRGTGLVPKAQDSAFLEKELAGHRGSPSKLMK